MNTASFIRRCSQLFVAILSSLLIGNHGYEAFSQEVPVAKPMSHRAEQNLNDSAGRDGMVC